VPVVKAAKIFLKTVNVAIKEPNKAVTLNLITDPYERAELQRAGQHRLTDGQEDPIIPEEAAI